MGYEAKILLDSINQTRLTTFEITIPRLVLSEFNTHRVFSRNSSSSRAIPVEKMIEKVENDPFIPEYWGKNQKGMQADQELTEQEQIRARTKWLDARDNAVASAKLILGIGVHKQITNRLLEPWLWHTVIVTATEWSNFFALRNNKMAQPEIAKPAKMMRDLYDASVPTVIGTGEWHMPLMPDIDYMGNISLEDKKKISAGRCARVSYLTHHGVRDLQADIKLCEDLINKGHMSPLEHVATPHSGFRPGTVEQLSNFRGWKQFRKEILHEDDFGARS